MSLFQNSVVNKYSKDIDRTAFNKAWRVFTEHFHNTDIQSNIRNSKEEQYQEGFMHDLFVKVFGYIPNPEPNYNLIPEQKNEKDSKKSDGAILNNGNVTAVIELKGTSVTDLGKIEQQAFGYKNNQAKCTYVITSNFEKLRFYIDNAIEFLEFNLFELTQNEFELLWLCIQSDNLLNDIPKKIKTESLTQEEAITKNLYKDYSTFRRDVFTNLVSANPEIDKLTLFKKTQKLLDRFLFVFFAEDRNLIPPNSIRIIIKEWEELRDRFKIEQPLYQRFKEFFEYLNVGRNDKHMEIFAYNGGLFQSDGVIDKINIDDDILYNHTKKLADYDFESEVSVNILGHIFEHSLNEIEEIQEEIEDENRISSVIPTDTTTNPTVHRGEKDSKKKISKRKKDGVYYTPKYITKYIVENTIGRLCDEKKQELAIEEEQYEKERKGRSKETIAKLNQKLEDYRKWLLELTICDPACGSGAFLNQALEFLIEEHSYIDELQNKLLGEGFVIQNIENKILENNLYGVDINEESVEIAKLSLWLRTARKGRKLSSLNNNIKCGNSLIDDPEVAGDKAFKWEQEFPQVFREKEKKAFHVTWSTYGSRKVLYNDRSSEIKFTDSDRNSIAKIIDDYIEKEKYDIVELNILHDHVHIILICEENELPRIIGKIKGYSSHEFQKEVRSGADSDVRRVNPTVSTHTEKENTDIDTSPTDSITTSPKVHRGDHSKSAQYSDGTISKLWASGYDRRNISNEEQLNNTGHYIKNNHIKHGISELEYKFKSLVTFQHAFRPEYTGGFDVVIGNPPYGAKLESHIQKYLNDTYIKGGSETAISFIKLGYDKLQKQNSNFAYIVPKSLTFSSNYKSIREHILDDIQSIIDCGKVWKDVKLEQVIFTITKSSKIKNYKTGLKVSNEILITGQIEKEYIKTFGLLLNGITSLEFEIALKMTKYKSYLNDFSSNSRGGIFQNKLSENGDINVLGGAEIQRDGIVGVKGKINKVLIENDDKNFIKPNSVLVQRIVAHIEKPIDHLKITACLPEETDFAIVDTINQITVKSNFSNKFIWILLNSKLINWYAYRFIFGKAIRTMQFDNPTTNKIPIPELSPEAQQPFIEKADIMLDKNKELQEISNKFTHFLQTKFNLDKLSKKLDDWNLLEEGEFLKELKKKKVKLSLEEEMSWSELFNKKKAEALAIKEIIDRTDKEIDQMVYKLYELAEEEIKIVEGV